MDNINHDVSDLTNCVIAYYHTYCWTKGTQTEIRLFQESTIGKDYTNDINLTLNQT